MFTVLKTTLLEWFGLAERGELYHAGSLAKLFREKAEREAERKAVMQAVYAANRQIRVACMKVRLKNFIPYFTDMEHDLLDGYAKAQHVKDILEGEGTEIHKLQKIRNVIYEIEGKCNA